MTFGQRFRSLREELELTQSEAADRVGLTRHMTVSDWERGVKNAQPSSADQERYLRLLRTPIVAEASPDAYALGFRDALAQVRSAVKRVAATHERQPILAVSDAVESETVDEVAPRLRQKTVGSPRQP
jgi:transcriptional regulator with XRE-family HTH domain